MSRRAKQISLSFEERRALEPLIPFYSDSIVGKVERVLAGTPPPGPPPQIARLVMVCRGCGCRHVRAARFTDCLSCGVPLEC